MHTVTILPPNTVDYITDEEFIDEEIVGSNDNPDIPEVAGELEYIVWVYIVSFSISHSYIFSRLLVHIERQSMPRKNSGKSSATFIFATTTCLTRKTK